MSFYSDLKQPQSYSKHTVSDIVRKEYGFHVDYITSRIMESCSAQKYVGRHCLSGYMYCNLDSDGRYTFEFGAAPKVRIGDNYKRWKEIHEDRNFKHTVDNIATTFYGEKLDTQLVISLANDVQRCLSAEGFPADSVKAVSFNVQAPTDFFFSNPVKFVNLGQWPMIQVEIRW